MKLRHILNEMVKYETDPFKTSASGKTITVYCNHYQIITLQNVDHKLNFGTSAIKGYIDGDICRAVEIFVVERFRNAGIGRELLKRLKSYCVKHNLKLYSSNVYSKQGSKFANKNKDLFDNEVE